MKLFAPGWMSKNSKRAMKSVCKLKDDVDLHRAALKAPLALVCAAAVEKLTDESFLVDIAKKCHVWRCA